MERLTHRRSDGSAYTQLDMQTCLNRLADYEDVEESVENMKNGMNGIAPDLIDQNDWMLVTDKTERNWG